MANFFAEILMVVEIIAYIAVGIFIIAGLFLYYCFKVRKKKNTREDRFDYCNFDRKD